MTEINKKEVQSISEAFSQTPALFYIGSYCGINGRKVSNIILEFESNWPNGTQRGEYVYHGYDVDGNILFEFLANSVNVTYKN